MNPLSSVPLECFVMQIDISQLEFIDKNLRSLLLWIENKTGMKLKITSLFRIGDNGVHGTLPLRGTDLRCRDANVGKEIEKIINKAWIYDPKRPNKTCAFLHGTGSNLHLHIQTHPNTDMRA